MTKNAFSNILIIKPSSLGDIVHALPAVMALRRAFPAAKLTWMVRPQFAGLLETIREIDNLLFFDRNAMAAWFCKPQAFKCFWAFRKQLKQAKYDLVIDFQGLLRSALFARMTGCENRIGLAEAREGSRYFYTAIVPPPTDSYHIIDYYFAVLKELGVAAESVDFGIHSDNCSAMAIGEKMSKSGLKTGKFLVLVPSSAHASKCWPAERFAQIAERLHDQYQLDVAAIGTSQDKEIISRIQSQCRIPIADLSGQTKLMELVALFEQSAAVISNDTGPGHISSALNIPTVMIFGHTNPLRLGPYRKPQCAAAIDIEKRGSSIDDQNPAYHIEHISVDMVIDKLVSQLNRTSEK